MRILHVITGLLTGGAERALYNLLSGGLTESGEHAVLSLSNEGTFGPRIRELAVPVSTLGLRWPLPGTAPVFRLRRLVQGFRPDVIQGWMYHGNLAASLAQWLAPGYPAVAWNVRQSLYGLAGEKPMTRQVIRANRFLSSRVDAILYNSRLSRRQHETFGFTAGRGQVIPNGFDLKQLRPDLDKRKEVRRALGMPDSARVVGHVARFHPMKDHALLLRTAVHVAESLPDIRFLLVGRDVDLDKPTLAGIVPNRMEGRFLCLGERHDVPDLMQAMDVMCLSSAWGEGFPNVLGEAMALGVPCVATDVGDSAFVVGDTGMIVPSRNEDALAKGLLTVLNMPDDARRELGLAARDRIEANYALPRIVDLYADLYKGLTATADAGLANQERR